MGVCGEKCPKICVECDPKMEVFDETFMMTPIGDEFLEGAIVIQLSSCNHMVELGAMDAYVANFQTADVKILPCPVCRGPMFNPPHRYKARINQDLQNLQQVKLQLQYDYLRRLLAKKELDKVEPLVTSLLKVPRWVTQPQPPDLELLLIQIEMLVLQDRNEEAEEAHKKALEWYPNDPTLAKLAEQLNSFILAMVRQAIPGIPSGGWLKCQCGFVYAVGECGGTMQKSKCLNCGIAVGGTNHNMVSTSSRLDVYD